MGVMKCGKEGCNAIPYNLYSTKHGYICNGCFSDLIQYCKQKENCSDETITEFMEIPKTNSATKSPDTIEEELIWIFQR